MKGLPAILLALLLLVPASPAVNLRNRSISSSGQFVLYCDDRDARGRIISFVEDVKTELLRILRENDAWKFPIVIVLEPEPDSGPAVDKPPVATALVNTIAGPKVDMNVRVGADPAKIFLQRHILHALLLEMSHRERGPILAGGRYPEPPWWLVEGLLQRIRASAGMRDPDVFRSIVNTEKLPSLEKLITQPPVNLDTAAGAVDRACAMALVEALLRLPNGAANLGRFIRSWGGEKSDPMTLMGKHFPVLADSQQGLAKWWTLQIAALGKAEEGRGLSAAESEADIVSLLTLEIAVSSKPMKMEKFPLGDFVNYLRLPGARAALRTAQVRIATLGARAHFLYRPIVVEYEQVCGLLADRKTKDIPERLAALERQRKSVLQRTEQITDYLNWYEATQTPGTTGQFDKYLRAVEAMQPKPKPKAPAIVDPRIAEYLDSLEDEFAPLRPDMIPGPQSDGSALR